MFCQDGSTKSSLTTLKMSQQILEASHYDHLTSIRLSGVNDLKPSEGKYHADCHKQFLRNTSRRKQNTKCDILLLRPKQIHCMERLYRASWTTAKSWKNEILQKELLKMWSCLSANCTICTTLTQWTRLDQYSSLSPMLQSHSPQQVMHYSSM